MKNIDLIDAYFNNSLTPEEQLLFNELLQNDEEFKREYIFQNDLKKVIAINQKENLKSTLQSFEDDIQKNKTFLISSKKWIIAASITLLVALGFWSFKNIYYPSTEKLYSQNFEPYRNIIQPIVRGENLNTIEYRAFVAYENKDYHKAINLFNSVKNPNETYILFYKAMCYLSINKASKAINLLETLSLLSNQDEDNQKLSNKAYWYLGLAYLKTDDKKGAISNFLIVRDQPCNECKKSKRSENLLKHLK